MYAGAVMVMFLFVIAYLGGHADTPWAGGPTWQRWAAVVAAGALLMEIVMVIGFKAGGRLSDEADIREAFGSPAQLGRYRAVFVDSITVAFRLCLQWCKGQPQAMSDRSGRQDLRGA